MESLFFFFFSYSPEVILIDFREGGRERKREQEREREREGEREERDINMREKHGGAASHNLGMCPDRGSNPQPSSVWDDAPTSGTTWPGRVN